MPHQVKKEKKVLEILSEVKTDKAFNSLRLVPKRTPSHEGTGKDQGNAQSGKRIRDESGDSSLRLGIHENDVGRPTVSLLLEQDAPSVALEIEGRARSLIVDMGSNNSIFQPGVSRNDVRDYP